MTHVPDMGGKTAQTSEHGAGQGLGLLTLSALGVVYGDIGTSPIYALRETVAAASGAAVPTDKEIIGALSIILWSLTIVVALKYALLVLRADNKGEGGTLSIMALSRRVMKRRYALITGLGIVGASLFLGDAFITPAISVLSAVEGMEVAVPAFGHLVVPITCGILIGLFAVQRFGTARVSNIFGPLMLVWFVVLGVSGAVHVADDLHVLAALNPLVAAGFVAEHSNVAIAVLGAAFLAVTGAEALYVDLGHFGRKPILVAWFGVAFPALVLNYFGQAAFLLDAGAKVKQPLFEMMPSSLQIPMVLLATIATVIASQAVITGAFSLVRQAIRLQFLPRLNIIHTSDQMAGQIYLPMVNWFLLIGVLLLVIGFGSSEKLAAAYGLSVTGEMLVTTLLLAVVMGGVWRWSRVKIAALILPFIVVDLAFLSANIVKIPDGGWVSILIALALVILMGAWLSGNRDLLAKTHSREVPLADVVASLDRHLPHQVPGTAIFLSSNLESAPTALLHSLKHYKVLHENNIILTVRTAQRPYIPLQERVNIKQITPWLSSVTLLFGYMEDPNVPRALGACRKAGLKFDIMSTSFFLSRRSLVSGRGAGVAGIKNRIYKALARNAVDASHYFRLPTGRVIEIGTQVLI